MDPSHRAMSPRSADGGGRRAVVLVHNPVAPYSRALRVARSLAGEGWEVLIAGLARSDLPEDDRDGSVRIIRVAPAGSLARFVSAPGGRRAHLVATLDRVVGRMGRALARVPGLGFLRAARTPTPRRILGVLRWPLPARAWTAGLTGVLPPADVYHACGVAALVAASNLAARARQGGRAGLVVYDVIDLFLEGNRYATMPRPLRGRYAHLEGDLVERADAVVTVNEVIADELAMRWRLRDLPVVLRNCPPWAPPPASPRLLRDATGLPEGVRLVLFLGALGPDRGLLEAGEAVLRVPDAALVALGFGPWFEKLRARDTDPRFAGRHVTLPAVHPDEVREWAAGADAMIVAVPGDSLNQRLSTPNKFWEGLTAGIPLVIGRDLAVMRRIVEENDLGAVADPRDPEDLAAALRAVLDAPPAIREARRERALGLARTRYRWDIEVRDYLALTEGLVPGAPSGPETTPARGEPGAMR
jgi:glycosyltransferase involved in cell wall biosynthesis